MNTRITGKSTSTVLATALLLALCLAGTAQANPDDLSRWQQQAQAVTITRDEWGSARAITAGGESGHPDSPHFNDEAERYTTGNLRTVYFWPEQLEGHVERVYQPGK